MGQRGILILRSISAAGLVVAGLLTALRAAGYMELAHPERSSPWGLTPVGWLYIFEGAALVVLAMAAVLLIRRPLFGLSRWIGGSLIVAAIGIWVGARLW
jgi:hypothetical protein